METMNLLVMRRARTTFCRFLIAELYYINKSELWVIDVEGTNPDAEEINVLVGDSNKKAINLCRENSPDGNLEYLLDRRCLSRGVPCPSILLPFVRVNPRNNLLAAVLLIIPVHGRRQRVIFMNLSSQNS